MYVCGPTVYGLIHVGNCRPLVFFDVVRRYLEFNGYRVTYVMNYTDVDDKIITRAREETIPAGQLAEKYIKEFEREAKSLGVREPSKKPRVTEHIPGILTLIRGLVENGSAYVADDGEVFFSVRKFPGYGKLSGKNIDELLIGARVQPNEKKRDPLDFSLWKPQKAEDEPAWESPWGKGRPGWHIECSAMTRDYFGDDTFDIHGGGMDLLHPHHENEIAQSESFSHKPFVKYWLHNNLLTIESEKMSKSLGNIFLAREFLEKYGAETLKFILLSGHYRSPIDFSERHIRESRAALHRYYSAVRKCEKSLKSSGDEKLKSSAEETKAMELTEHFEERWQKSMDDDFNTAEVVGLVFEYVRVINACFDRKHFTSTPNTAKIAQSFSSQMKALSQILNIFGENSETFLKDLRESFLKERGIEASDIEQKIAIRTKAREKKDFGRADQIRAELLKVGIELRDLDNKTEWDVILV